MQNTSLSTATHSTSLIFTYQAASAKGGKEAAQGKDRHITGQNEDGSIQFGVVCDGVSTSALGREAAEWATSFIKDKLSKHSPDQEKPNAFARELLREVHQAIVDKYGPGQALCTIVLAIINTKHNYLTLASAGDSFGCLYTQPGKLEQLTELDVTYRLVTENGQIVRKKDGAPLIARAVTQVLGRRGQIQVHTYHHEYKAGEFLALFTDGIHQEDVKELIEGYNYSEEAMQAFVHKQSIEQEDDATLILFELGQVAESMIIREKLPDWSEMSKNEKDDLLELMKQVPPTKPMLLFEALLHEEVEETCQALFKQLVRTQTLTHQQGIQLLNQAALRNQRKWMKDLAYQLHWGTAKKKNKS